MKYKLISKTFYDKKEYTVYKVLCKNGGIFRGKVLDLMEVYTVIVNYMNGILLRKMRLVHLRKR